MNTKEKKSIQRQMVERYFRYKTFVDSFKFRSWIPVIIYVIIKIIDVIGVLTIESDSIIKFSWSIFLGLIVVGVVYHLLRFLFETINLNEIEKQIGKATFANGEKISAYEKEISDKENPTKEDIKLQLKIRKLEIRQEKLNIELDLLDKAK